MDTFRAINLKQKSNIYRKPDDIPPATVVEFFNRTVENFPSHSALASRDKNYNKWNLTSYQEYKSRVEKIAKIFIKLGLKENDVVAIFAWNCSEWVIAALGAIYAGGVTTSIYTTSTSSTCEYILESSQTAIIIIDSIEKLQKINKIKNDLPHLKHIIQLSELNLNFIENVILNWHELLKLDTSDVEMEYQRRLKNMTPNKCCTVMYTSGTTGFPKGVMLSHDNIIWNVKKSVEVMKRADVRHEILISYLPLSHLTAFMVDIFIAIYSAATVYFTDMFSLNNSLQQILNEIQPTFFVGVPRVYENIEEKLTEKMNEFNLIKRKILSWSQNVISQNYFQAQNSSFLKCEFVNYFIINRIKETLGFQRCRLFISGSAPLSVETKRFFISLNMPIYEAYGMTESSTVHSLTSHQIQIQSLECVGLCLDGTETKIINNMNLDVDGEICIRGRHIFMGYLNDMENTMKTIDDDGWLHTGDMGRIDENGLIYLTGRLKEMIIMKDGENIPRTRIENLVKSECSAISHAFLIGDKRKFLTILLTLKTEIDADGKPTNELTADSQRWFKENGLIHTKLCEILQSNDEKLLGVFQNVIDRVNSQALSNPQKIQKFVILPNDFSVPTGELTPTLKVKKLFVLEKYQKIINDFYL